MSYDLKNLPIISSGLTDSSIVFGAKDGQSDVDPDPINLSALWDYVLDKMESAQADAQTALGITALVESAAESAATASEAAEVASGAMTALLNPIFSTVATAEAYSPDAAPDYIRTAGYAAAGDGGGALYRKIDAEPAHAGKFSITLSDGLSVVWYELAEIVITAQMFGAAVDDDTDDTSAIQDAVDFLVDRGGGKLVITGTAKITDAIVIGSNIELEGARPGAALKQYTDDVPVVDVSKAGLNSRWAISNLTLTYANQQTTSETDAIGLKIGGENVLNFLFVVERVTISRACTGIALPEETNCTAFLASFKDVLLSNCADWAFDWRGAASGARTNLVLERVWALQTNGSEQPQSKGFRIARTDGLRIDNVGCDHTQGQPFSFQTCRGTIGTIFAESCDLAASSGNISLFRFSGCVLEIGNVYAIDNSIDISGTAEFYLIRPQDSTIITRIGILEDIRNEVTDTSGGNAYTIAVSSDSNVLDVGRYRYSAGNSPAPNGSLADFGTIRRIHKFDGKYRSVALNTYQTISADANETLTPYSSGHIVRHTGTLTADRTITLATSGAVPGVTRFRITRTGGGGFNLNVHATGPLRAMAQNTWAEFVYDGSDYFVAAAGTLASG